MTCLFVSVPHFLSIYRPSLLDCLNCSRITALTDRVSSLEAKVKSHLSLGASFRGEFTKNELCPLIALFICTSVFYDAVSSSLQSSIIIQTNPLLTLFDQSHFMPSLSLPVALSPRFSFLLPLPPPIIDRRS